MGETTELEKLEKRICILENEAVRTKWFFWAFGAVSIALMLMYSELRAMGTDINQVKVSMSRIETVLDLAVEDEH